MKPFNAFRRELGSCAQYFFLYAISVELSTYDGITEVRAMVTM
ncbi:hypothetical protein [Candidatus Anaplasma sp. TIGMIC]|nr:hypothetical protein [Candidatus Anaplasma sp. TIGMIC]MDB1135392.1 hypothetical protein [Candidatus Anaplasma sp. TIGMIC]